MGLAIIRGPESGPFDLCHCCVMIYKGDMFKNKKMVDQVNAAIEKNSTTVTIISATITGHWEPEEAVTIGPSIYGTFGACCWTHIAAHDEEKYQQRKQQVEQAALAMKYGIDPATLAGTDGSKTKGDN